MKRCHNITCWTDYPFNDEPSRIRHVQVLCYDGDKYATVRDLDTGEIEHVKAGYLYRKAEAVKILRDVEEHIRRQTPLLSAESGIGFTGPRRSTGANLSA